MFGPDLTSIEHSLKGEQNLNRSKCRPLFSTCILSTEASVLSTEIIYLNVIDNMKFARSHLAACLVQIEHAGTLYPVGYLTNEGNVGNLFPQLRLSRVGCLSSLVLPHPRA